MIRRPDSVVQHKFDRDITRSTINSPLLRFPAISNIHARTREIARDSESRNVWARGGNGEKKGRAFSINPLHPPRL